MVEEGADVNGRDSEGCSPLHWACDRGSLQVVPSMAAPQLCDTLKLELTADPHVLKCDHQNYLANSTLSLAVHCHCTEQSKAYFGSR